MFYSARNFHSRTQDTEPIRIFLIPGSGVIYSWCVSTQHILAAGELSSSSSNQFYSTTRTLPPSSIQGTPLHAHHQTAHSSRSDHICHKTTSENWEYTLRMINHSVCPGRWTCAQPPILSISGSMLTAKPHVAGDTHSNEETHTNVHHNCLDMKTGNNYKHSLKWKLLFVRYHKMINKMIRWRPKNLKDFFDL